MDVSILEEWKRIKVMDFLDRGAGLFSGPVEDHNKAFNVLNILYRDFGIIDMDLVVKIQKFFQQHKECGVYVVLIPE